MSTCKMLRNEATNILPAHQDSGMELSLVGRTWCHISNAVQFSSVAQSCPTLCDPMALGHSNSWSLLKLMSIELVMPSSHLILCHPLLLLPPIPPSITVSSSESTLRMRWPNYWSFSFSISHYIYIMLVLHNS